MQSCSATTSLNDIRASTVADANALQTDNAPTANDGLLVAGAAVDAVDGFVASVMPAQMIAFDSPAEDNRITINATAAVLSPSSTPVVASKTESTETDEPMLAKLVKQSSLTRPHPGTAIDSSSSNKAPATTQPALMRNVNAAASTANATTTNPSGKASLPSVPAVQQSNVQVAPLRRPSGVGESAKDAPDAVIERGTKTKSTITEAEAAAAISDVAKFIETSAVRDVVSKFHVTETVASPNDTIVVKMPPKSKQLTEEEQGTQTSIAYSSDESIQIQQQPTNENVASNDPHPAQNPDPDVFDPSVQLQMQQGELMV